MPGSGRTPNEPLIRGEHPPYWDAERHAAVAQLPAHSSHRTLAVTWH